MLISLLMQPNPHFPRSESHHHIQLCKNHQHGSWFKQSKSKVSATICFSVLQPGNSALSKALSEKTQSLVICPPEVETGTFYPNRKRFVTARGQRMLFSQALPINHLFCGKRGAAKPNVSPLFFPRANVPGNFSGSTLPAPIENHCQRRRHLKMRRRLPEGGRRLQGKKLFYQKYAVFDVVRCANKVFACQQ